jgi:hypothetical protein
MKHAHSFCLFFSLSTAFLFSQSNLVPEINQSAVSASQTAPKAQSTILDDYGKLPLSFEANRGQTASHVKFLSRTSSFMLFLTGDEAVFALNGRQTDTWKEKIARVSRTPPSGTTYPKAGGVLRMKLRNANPDAKITGGDELAGISNYFTGNDPAKWRTNVPTYRKVKYKGIYSGIDLVYYGNHRQLEYDFIVAPGANPRRIAFDVRGAKCIRQNARGDLVFRVGGDEIRWHKPVAYQEKNGTRQEVGARYAITDTNRVGFEVAKYDASRELYIDPLVYSTYLGGSGGDIGAAIAVDSTGDAYVMGTTTSNDFPVSSDAFQTTCNRGDNCGTNGGDVFVTKLNPSGSAVLYSTYLGGAGPDSGAGIAVDGEGNAYVTGTTGSSDFPTVNPLQPTFSGGRSDAFVTELNPTGSALVYSTYLGGKGDDSASGIAVDGAGDVYVTGATDSTDFPTKNPLQSSNLGGVDAFVSKIKATGSAVIYSTYLGGSGADLSYGVAIDSAGAVYVTGYTESSDFPTVNPLQSTNHAATTVTGFVTKINPKGSGLVYSTYLGGSFDDEAQGVAVDRAGNVYITGFTLSNDFPITPGAFQTNCNGGSGCSTYGDAFVTKLDSTGSSLLYSTYLGGSHQDWGVDIAIDGAGGAFITGLTLSTNFPVVNPLGRKHGRSEAFVARLNPTGSALVYSTYLGGQNADYGSAIAVDNTGNSYVTGYTESTDFPTMNPLQPASGGSSDAFVTKLYLAAGTTIALSSSPNPSSHGETVTFNTMVNSGLGAPPDGETVSFMKGKTVLGTGTLSGGSAIFTTSSLKVGTTSVTAVYGGDSNFAGSKSNVVKQVVEKD